MSATVKTAPFCLSADEILRAVKVAYPVRKGWLERRPGWQRAGLVALLFLAVLAALDGLPRSGWLLWMLLALFVGLAAGVWLTSSLVARHTRRIVGAAAAREVPATIAYSDTGIEVASDDVQQNWRWRSVERSVVVGDLLVLATGLQPITCPARALPEGLTLAELQSRVEAWREAAAP